MSHKRKVAIPEHKALWRAPHSLDIMPCDFSLGGFVKDYVYFPPLPNNLPDLGHRIEEVIASITLDLLIELWEELDFELNVYCIAKCTPIYFF